MDTAKFLRALADVIDNAQKTENQISGEPEIKSDETDVMVPPLQQEIELMKKATNVDSIFDKTETVVDDSLANDISDNEELTILKKNAGLGLGLIDDSAER